MDSDPSKMDGSDSGIERFLSEPGRRLCDLFGRLDENLCAVLDADVDAAEILEGRRADWA